jgi:hypothetical protein
LWPHLAKQYEQLHLMENLQRSGLITHLLKNNTKNAAMQFIANDEQGQANFWRWATIIFFA